MIALAVSLIMALAFGGIAWVARLHPVEILRRSILGGASVAAVASLIVGLLLYPRVSVWQEYQAGLATVSKYDIERIRAEHMIHLLGSPEAYIEYLKATKGEN